MFGKRSTFVLLIVAVLSSLVDAAVAQSEPQQFVVVCVEFKPAKARPEAMCSNNWTRAPRIVPENTGSTSAALKTFHLDAADREFQGQATGTSIRFAEADREL